MRFFNNITNLEDLKKEYRKLAKKYHPDLGGSTELMQELNAEYDALFAKLKNTHKAKDGTTYQKETTETPEEFKDIINALITLEGIDIEIIGSWLWVTGNTFSVKDTLKSLKFRFSSKKTAWYYHTEDSPKKSHKTFTLDEIRDIFGSEKVKSQAPQKLNA